MKLQELLKTADFDKMFEYIVKFDHKTEGSRFGFQVAYELLCDMELPDEEDCGETEVVHNPFKDDNILTPKFHPNSAISPGKIIINNKCGVTFLTSSTVGTGV